MSLAESAGTSSGSVFIRSGRGMRSGSMPGSFLLLALMKLASCACSSSTAVARSSVS